MNFLEDYIDTMESLPMELQRNFSLMQDLDAKAQRLLATVQKETLAFTERVRAVSPNERKMLLRRMTEALVHCTKHGEEKVALATQTYDVVDRHIRRLDDDLQRFEDEQMTGPVRVPRRISQGAATIAKASRKAEADIRESTPNKKRRHTREGTKTPEPRSATPVKNIGRDKSRTKEPERSKGSSNGIIRPKEKDKMSRKMELLSDMDMPVDPNEPTYCICSQVSFGEMIACDNENCPIEWYHYACVELTAPPKGKWYCPTCRAPRDKKKK